MTKEVVYYEVLQHPLLMRLEGYMYPLKNKRLQEN